MRHKLEVVGSDGEALLGMLRELSTDFDVELIDEQGPSLDPVDDIAFYVGRCSSYLLRMSTMATTMKSMNNKMARIQDALESIAESQRRLVSIEQERREEEVRNIRK